MNRSLFSFLLFTIHSAPFAMHNEFHHPTLEQLCNADKIDITLACRRDFDKSKVNMKSWLSMVKSIDNLVGFIEKCNSCPDDKDAELFEEVCNTIRFIRNEHCSIPNQGIQRLLNVGHDSTRTQEEVTMNGQNFILSNSLCDEQSDELFNLYNQNIDPKVQTIQELDEILRNSLFYILIDRSNQKIVGFIRAVTDYVRFAGIFDLVIDQEYKSEELEKFLVDKILGHSKIKNLPLIEIH